MDTQPFVMPPRSAPIPIPGRHRQIESLTLIEQSPLGKAKRGDTDIQVVKGIKYMTLNNTKFLPERKS